MRKGLTLVELLIGIVLSLIIISATIFLFSFAYKQILSTNKASQGTTSLFQAIEIIDSDLQKAGYGVPEGVTPVEWSENETEKSLTIEYINYEESTCENETFGNNTCSYRIIYTFKEGNLYRTVDKGADGDSAKAPMFFVKNVVIKDFKVHIDTQKHLVNYSIIASVNGNTLQIGDTIKCNNWK